VKRVLKPSGFFICSTLNKKAFGPKRIQSGYHCYEFTCGEFKQTLQSYFQKVEIYGQRFLCADAKIDLHPLNSYIIRLKRLLGLKENSFPRIRSLIVKLLFGERPSDVSVDDFPIDLKDPENAPFVVAACSKTEI